MKKVSKYALLILALIIVLAFFAGKGKPDSFFYWCDGYVAIAENEKLTLTLTYFYDKAHIDFSDVVHVDFLNASKISVDSYDIFKRDGGPKFKSYGIDLNLSMKQQGKEVCKYLVVKHANGNEDKLPLGTWIFEIGPEDCGLVDTWESPALSSNSQEFVYTYTRADEAVEIEDIQCVDGQSSMDMDVSGAVINGTIALPGNAPMKYVRSKIILKSNDQTMVSYGKGCYCGAMNVTEASIVKSKEYFEEALELDH